LLEQLPHAYFICFIVILFGFNPVFCMSSFAFFSIISLNFSFVYSASFSRFLFSFSIVFCIHSVFCSTIFSISFLLTLFGAFTVIFPFFICSIQLSVSRPQIFLAFFPAVLYNRVAST